MSDPESNPYVSPGHRAKPESSPFKGKKSCLLIAVVTLSVGALVLVLLLYLVFALWALIGM